MVKSFECDSSAGIEVRPVQLGRYHGSILSPYDDPKFLEAILEPKNLWKRPDARVLLNTRNRVSAVRVSLSNGREVDVVVKEFWPRGVNRLKSLIQASRAERAWRGALALQVRGLDTAPPVAYLEVRRTGFLRFVEHSLFLAEEVKPGEEIRTLFRTLRFAELRPLLANLSAHLALCHERGVLHRDLSDGNILVHRTDDGRLKFYLLDTTRIRLRRRLGRFTRVKNLIRLGIPADLQDFFLAEYCRHAGWQAGPGLRAWYKINKSFFTGYIAMKRKLRLRQIARKMRVQ